MATYSDDEQIEVLRRWWAENGTGVVLAIVLAVAALLGWRQWTSWQNDRMEAASIGWQELISAVEEARSRPDSASQQARIEAIADSILEDHGDSAYADYARLMLARLAVEEGDYTAAADRLREVLADPETDAMRWLATLRLARVLTQTGAFDDALALVDGAVPEAFAGQALELKGDIMLARGDTGQARAAYAAALEKVESDASRRLVQMKLDDLVPAS